jgi:hypothetical protein
LLAPGMPSGPTCGNTLDDTHGPLRSHRNKAQLSTVCVRIERGARRCQAPPRSAAPRPAPAHCLRDGSWDT